MFVALYGSDWFTDGSEVELTRMHDSVFNWFFNGGVVVLRFLPV